MARDPDGPLLEAGDPLHEADGPQLEAGDPLHEADGPQLEAGDLLLEADGPDLEAEGLPRLAVITGEEVDQRQLAKLRRSDLEDCLRLLIRLFGLKNNIIRT